MLEQENDEDGRQTARNPEVHFETWAETCAAPQMTPQRSLFNWVNVGADVVVHRPLKRGERLSLLCDHRGEGDWGAAATCGDTVTERH